MWLVKICGNCAGYRKDDEEEEVEEDAEKPMFWSRPSRLDAVMM